MGRASQDRSLLWTLIVAVLVVAVLSALFFWALIPVRPSALKDGITNVASIGGIVSGLSLSGTAVLTLSGRYKTAMVDAFGPKIRLVLFGGFCVLVAASLACAISVMWAGEIWVKILLAVTGPTMLVTLVATALLINSAFAWQSQKPEPSSPLKSK